MTKIYSTMENLRRWQSSRKAYRAHLTKLHQTVTEIMDSSEAIDNSKLDSLSTCRETATKGKSHWRAGHQNCWRDTELRGVRKGRV